jgi:hypothetical protein
LRLKSHESALAGPVFPNAKQFPCCAPLSSDRPLRFCELDDKTLTIGAAVCFITSGGNGRKKGKIARPRQDRRYPFRRDTPITSANELRSEDPLRRQSASEDRADGGPLGPDSWTVKPAVSNPPARFAGVY